MAVCPSTTSAMFNETTQPVTCESSAVNYKQAVLNRPKHETVVSIGISGGIRI
jgi:hypothetical protein